jgi:hypothetical protein
MLFTLGVQRTDMRVTVLEAQIQQPTDRAGLYPVHRLVHAKNMNVAAGTSCADPICGFAYLCQL